MPSYRERIVELIARQGTASAPELSRILGISKPAVQYHIGQLLSAGAIQTTQTEQSSHTRGRPILYYQIAINRSPHNFENLSAALLVQMLASQQNDQEKDVQLRTLAVKLAGQAGQQTSFIRQIDQAVQRLSEHGYQPYWEVAKGGSVIRLRNCPYAPILPKCPALCRMDELLLEHLLGTPVRVKQLWRDHPQTKTDCEFFFRR